MRLLLSFAFILICLASHRSHAQYQLKESGISIIDKLTQPYKGRNLSLSELDKIVREISQDGLFQVVYVESLGGGKVVIRAQQSMRIEKLVINGNRSFSDDEIIEVNLQQVPANINRIVVGVSIHDFEKRQQNFGQVDNAFVRIVDSTSESEITRYDLTEDFSVETALVVAELYRKNNEWFINAIGKGYQGGLQKLLEIYY